MYIPFSIGYLLGFITEFIWTLFHFKKEPFFTRHSILLFGRNQWFPNYKAKRDFHYYQKKPLNEGIKESIQWFQQFYK